MTGTHPEEEPGAMIEEPTVMTPASELAADPNEDGAEYGEAIRAILQAVLDAGGLDARAELQQATVEGVEIAIEGPDAPALIGKQGQVLNSIQYLLGLMATRQLGERIRVTVDAENYRGRRAETLIKMARDLAAEVRAHNQEAVMDPLNAMERRIIHTALLEEPGIRTYSEGNEPDRRVVISPRSA